MKERGRIFVQSYALSLLHSLYFHRILTLLLQICTKYVQSNLNIAKSSVRKSLTILSHHVLRPLSSFYLSLELVTVTFLLYLYNTYISFCFFNQNTHTEKHILDVQWVKNLF